MKHILNLGAVLLLSLTNLGLILGKSEEEFNLDFQEEAERIRVVRQAPASEIPVSPPKVGRTFPELQAIYNLADPVSENYPVVFNIILFISVAFILSIIAIAVAISSMDPGKDSLIYRVTSGQKTKKDN